MSYLSQLLQFSNEVAILIQQLLKIFLLTIFFFSLGYYLWEDKVQNRHLVINKYVFAFTESNSLLKGLTALKD